MSNITQVVNVDKNMTTLKKGVIAAGLDKKLSEAGPFTIFAPSDKAFDKVDKQTLENLLKPENKAKLIELLGHHVVEGKIHYKDLKDGQKLKDINGKELHVHVKDGKFSLNGANIQGQDTEASNGVIFSLDTVMMHN
ncbi:MAG TPA: fasciclin domain-containing protein [Puia sp.]|jgi:uncharacterized surface protein with fasciclin (FAS1) repeats|nr:fasciclin domain-containing protein [Puia sp.]